MKYEIMWWKQHGNKVHECVVALLSNPQLVTMFPAGTSINPRPLTPDRIVEYAANCVHAIVDKTDVA